jgi:hypothetical protein
MVAEHPAATQHPAATSSAGYAVRDDALADYATAAGKIATDLSGFGHHELSTARTLPTDAFGSLAHQTGFTGAVVAFCGHATDAAHTIGAEVHDLAAGVDTARANYENTEHQTAARFTHAKGTSA